MKQISSSLSSVLVADAQSLVNPLERLLTFVLGAPPVVCADCAEVTGNLQYGLRPDIVLICYSGGKFDDFEIINELKHLNKTPTIIFLHNDKSDVGSAAFLAGVDDVVSWPSSPKELALRLCVRLGLNVDFLASEAAIFDLSTEAYIAERAGLTRIESQILNVLLDKTGEIVSRDELSNAVDGRPWAYGDRKFDVHVAKMRKKLAGAFGRGVNVSTIRLSGYRLTLNRAILDIGQQSNFAQ